MTELAGIDRSEMEESPEALEELYREDAEGLMSEDRSALAWKYSRIYGVYGLGTIEELGQLHPAERFIRRCELWQNIIALEREQRSIKPRRTFEY